MERGQSCDTAIQCLTRTIIAYVIHVLVRVGGETFQRKRLRVHDPLARVGLFDFATATRPVRVRRTPAPGLMGSRRGTCTYVRYCSSLTGQSVRNFASQGVRTEY